jgi:hypothetical protein
MHPLDGDHWRAIVRSNGKSVLESEGVALTRGINANVVGSLA